MEEEDNFVSREIVAPAAVVAPSSPAATPRSRATCTQPPQYHHIADIAKAPQSLSSSAPSLLSPAPLLNFMKRIKIAEAILQIQDLQVGCLFD